MCTVTRPGLASIAASTAVELLVSMIQHPAGYVFPFLSVPFVSLHILLTPPPSPPPFPPHPTATATATATLNATPTASSSIHAPPPPATPASRSAADTLDPDANNGVLGQVPHQLRGFLAQSFRNMPIVGAAYGRCTGCSEAVSSLSSPP